MTTNNKKQHVVDRALLNKEIDELVRELSALDVDDRRFEELIKKIARLSERRAALRKEPSGTK